MLLRICARLIEKKKENLMSRSKMYTYFMCVCVYMAVYVCIMHEQVLPVYLIYFFTFYTELVVYHLVSCVVC